MTKNNITLTLLDLLKKIYKDNQLISILIDNGFMVEDLYKLGYIGYDIDSGVDYNFNNPKRFKNIKKQGVK
jgi:hypothetical protein